MFYPENRPSIYRRVYNAAKYPLVGAFAAGAVVTPLHSGATANAEPFGSLNDTPTLVGEAPSLGYTDKGQKPFTIEGTQIQGQTSETSVYSPNSIRIPYYCNPVWPKVGQITRRDSFKVVLSASRKCDNLPLEPRDGNRVGEILREHSVIFWAQKHNMQGIDTAPDGSDLYYPVGALKTDTAQAGSKTNAVIVDNSCKRNPNDRAPYRYALQWRTIEKVAKDNRIIVRRSKPDHKFFIWWC